MRAQDAKAGTVTLCHITGSKKNPYKVIAVSGNALEAHLAHGDVARTDCCVAADCPGEGQACEAGRCVECRANADCGVCHACVGGRCRPVAEATVACDGSPLTPRNNLFCAVPADAGVCVGGACICGDVGVYDPVANACVCRPRQCGEECCQVFDLCVFDDGTEAFASYQCGQPACS